MHNDFYTSDNLAILDDIVNTFVDAQLQIINRETLLYSYNTTQRQSLVLLEDDGVHEIIAQKEFPKTDQTHQPLQETYNQDKLTLIMQGLVVTGSLLPSAFSLPANLSDASKRKKSFNWKPRFIFKREKLTFIAYRYPKTVDIHSLRSIAIRLLVNLCPYTDND
ncbi:hypothetical protein HMPREF1544_01670 [Mucor circinelloides 1006PhL]|uniref:Uncharacterized protein n=1 Tax=Mucor circinelloides f. circinelloides (strain 1006PhL) TaxID=1220926 RepID=S2JNK5_MUCC1|nr:hypothetical protein HMPREF1544_01670 [Mucor circinelloides 1006PhL]